MDQTDKNSFTGRVIREYKCRNCGHTDWEDDGIALWQALEDLEEKHGAKVAAQIDEVSATRQPEVSEPRQRPTVPLWQRLTDLFGRKRSLR